MVSIIIPTYNREKTILRSINSILNQTYQDFEIIVVDDNSSDNTEQIIKELNNKKIKYFKFDENKGACYARNYGVEKSSSEYIAFQDSDDYWYPNKLENQIKFIEEQKADVVFCQFESFDESEKFLKVTPKNNIKSGKISVDLIINKSIIGTPTIFLKKECFDNVNFDISLPRLQDWDLCIRLCDKYNVYYQKMILVKAYVQTNSISQNYEKGLKALELISKKHSNLLNTNKKASANIMLLKADYNKRLKNKYMPLIFKALKTHFSLNNLMRGLKIIIK